MMSASFAVLAFALADATPIIEEFGWEVESTGTDYCQSQFCAAFSDKAFFLYADLNGLPSSGMVDFTKISQTAPFVVQIVQGTSMVAIVEKYENGQKLWTVWGLEGNPLTVDGPAPINTHDLASNYIARYTSEMIRGRNVEQILAEEGFGLVDDYFSEVTGFNYYATSRMEFFPVHGDVPLGEWGKN